MKKNIRSIISLILSITLIISANSICYGESLADLQAKAAASQQAAIEAQAKADASQKAYEDLINGKSTTVVTPPVITVGSVGSSSAGPVAPKTDISTTYSKYVVTETGGDPVIGLWVTDIMKNIPKGLMNTFITHNGKVHIVSAQHQYGGVTYLIFKNNQISLSNPINMNINSDYIYGCTPDYLYHEFGHVFDAATGLSNSATNRAIITSEMPALQASVAFMYPNGSPFTTVQEATAEVYMATIGVKSGDISYAQSIINACPKTTQLINQYSALLK